MCTKSRPHKKQFVARKCLSQLQGEVRLCPKATFESDYLRGPSQFRKYLALPMLSLKKH